MLGEKAGLRIKELEERPSVPITSIDAWQCFCDLAGDRGLNGISPFTAVLAWCRTFGVRDLERHMELVRFLETWKPDGQN